MTKTDLIYSAEAWKAVAEERGKEVERLRVALADMVTIAKMDRWQEATTGRRIILESAEAVLKSGASPSGGTSHG